MHGSALVATGVVAVAVAAGAFVLLLRETWRGTISGRTVLALAIAYHVALLFVPLVFSRDVYSYAFYGKIAATYHANPYVATPADFRGDVLAAFVGPKWFDTPAVYGPLWTQISGVVVRVAGSVEAQVAVFRALAIAASLGAVAVVARVARSRWPSREAFAIAAVGANPVVLFQSAASGHNDLVVALAVAVALWFAFARRELGATAALALGALVKVTAGVPLVLYVDRARRGAAERGAARRGAAPPGGRGRARTAHRAPVPEHERSDARDGRACGARGLARPSRRVSSGGCSTRSPGTPSASSLADRLPAAAGRRARVALGRAVDPTCPGEPVARGRRVGVGVAPR